MTGYRCDLCESKNLMRTYAPLMSRRKATIYVCNTCGLVQSFLRGRNDLKKQPRLSYGADFGNLRYHKGIMASRAITFLRRSIDIKKRKHILDIGSNRGDILQRLRRIHPLARFTGVEPDRRVIGSYSSKEWLRIYGGRFEETRFKAGSFDLIVCFHTLEHVDSGRAFLEKIRRILSPEGVLYLEVPNLDAIGEKAIVEEFFIDKHRYFYDRSTLSRLLAVCGFKVLAEEIRTISLGMVAAKTEKDISPRFAGPASLIKLKIKRYENDLTKNISHLHTLTDFIRRNSGKRIILWGAGRIFNALISHTDLKPRDIGGVVDTFLIADTIRGFKILRPERSRKIRPDMVIIMSREYAGEIRKKARKIYGKGVRVISYKELLNV